MSKPPNTTGNTSTISKWDRRYHDSQSPGQCCWVLQNNLHLLPESGVGLDLACGLGANALTLAQNGLESHGWDSSAVALAKLQDFAKSDSLPVNTLLRDVEQAPPQANSFDVIVVSQFLYRPIFPALLDALKPGGLLFYQTFHQHKLSTEGPSSPDYLLAANELLTLLAPLQLLFYREDAGVGNQTQGLRDCSYYVGRRSEYPTETL